MQRVPENEVSFTADSRLELRQFLKQIPCFCLLLNSEMFCGLPCENYLKSSLLWFCESTEWISLECVMLCGVTLLFIICLLFHNTDIMLHRKWLSLSFRTWSTVSFLFNLLLEQSSNYLCISFGPLNLPLLFPWIFSEGQALPLSPLSSLEDLPSLTWLFQYLSHLGNFTGYQCCKFF